MKRFLSISVLLLFVLSIFISAPIRVSAEPAEGYDMIAENSKLEMWFNSKTADIMLRDKATGEEWKTFPENWGEETLSKGEIRNRLGAHVVLAYGNEKGESGMKNTNTFGVQRGYYKHNKITNGIRIDYDMRKEEGVAVSIEFTLTENGMSVRIPIDSVKDSEKARINEIRVLPFFGAGKKTDDGYVFYPDGSGALINFKDNFGVFREIAKPIYGQDKSKGNTDVLNDEIMRMPVFGMKKNNTGFLGIIESGDSMAQISAGVAGMQYSYYRTYPIFIYRDITKITIIQVGSGGNTTDYMRFSPTPMTEDIVVNYNLLTGDKANYSGMAEVYRDYLVNKGMKKNVDTKVDFDLTLLGGVKKRRIFMGIPMNLFTPLTTFDEAETILTELKSNGIKNINVRYLGFNDGGYEDKWTNKVSPSGKLGGKSGLKDLNSFAEKSGIDLFLSGELMQIFKSGKGFSTSRDAVRYVSKGVAMQYKYSIVSGFKQQEIKPWYLLAPTQLKEAVTGFVDSVKKYGLKNVALEDIGELVYSDYSKKHYMYRDKVGEVLDASMKELSKGMDRVMVTGGNAYTLPYATNIMSVPTDYSKLRIESESIPFYQMAIHGYIDYSGTPLNLAHTKTDEFLRLVEYGAVPHYIGMYEESSILKESLINNIYSANYKDWISDAKENYARVQEAYKDIVDKKMIGHEKVSEGVYKTTYENGVSIIVNYNDMMYYSPDGVNVKGKDFAVIGGGQN